MESSSAALSPGDPDDIVNKAELEILVGQAAPTLLKLMRKHPDFPVEERGSGGVPYKFSVTAVAAFLKTHSEETAELKAERDAKLAQWRLELFGGETADDDDRNLPPRERLEMIRAETEAMNLARARGELTRADHVRHCVETAFATLRKELNDTGAQLAKDRGFDRKDGVAIQAEIDVKLDRAAAILSQPGTYAVAA